MKSSWYLPVQVIVTALLGSAKPAMANGGHMHLGGIFFLLLGGLVFVAGTGVVFYLLLRPRDSPSDPDADDFDDEEEEEDLY
jgi:hypothetical protein